MFTVHIEARLEPAIRFLKDLERLMQAMEGTRAKEILAERLTESHQRAFDEGGWPGDPWAPTHEFWVEHLAKGHNRPMQWTGFAAANVRAVATPQGADVMGPAYLRKFLPGEQHRITETFPVAYDGEDWVKLSDADGGGSTKTKHIEVIERDLFRVTDDDMAVVLDKLMAEVGFA